MQYTLQEENIFTPLKFLAVEIIEYITIKVLAHIKIQKYSSS